MADNTVIKVYPVRGPVRAQLVNTAVWALAGAAVVGGAAGIVEVAFGDVDSPVPVLGAAVRIVITAILVLSGGVLLGVLVAYCAVKLGAGRRKWAAADRWIDEAMDKESSDGAGASG